MEEPVVDCVEPVVVEDVPVVERVPARNFTLVDVDRPGSTTTEELLRRFLTIVVLLSGAVATTWVRLRLAYFFFFFTMVTDDGRSSDTVTCWRVRLRTTTSGPDSLRTETLAPPDRRPAAGWIARTPARHIRPR